MNLELINKRHPCELCGGRGFLVGGDNESQICQRCEGDCDDPTFEQGRACGVEAERARCAAICDAHAAELQATADKYPAGTAACFVEEARELGRRMRGEK